MCHLCQKVNTEQNEDKLSKTNSLHSRIITKLFHSQRLDLIAEIFAQPKASDDITAVNSVKLLIHFHKRNLVLDENQCSWPVLAELCKFRVMCI